jgi:2-methylisocitrate lyase-like PEP mutase family enzyme
MNMSPPNSLALHFKSLHRPGRPLVLTNIWDAITASTVSSLPSTRALATASYAIAAAASLADSDLTLDVNLRAVAAIAKVAKNHGLPLTVDMQDGFGPQLEEGVRQVIGMGAVGINLEDYSREKEGLYTISEAQDRIRQVMEIATELGVPDFVVNARTDALFVKNSVDEAIQRGKAYLAAGASSVFIWGGGERRGWKREEVEKATKELDGKLNVILDRREGGLTVDELREIGVSRISLGPYLMRWMAERVGEEASSILSG